MKRVCAFLYRKNTKIRLPKHFFQVKVQNLFANIFYATFNSLNILWKDYCWPVHETGVYCKGKSIFVNACAKTKCPLPKGLFVAYHKKSAHESGLLWKGSFLRMKVRNFNAPIWRGRWWNSGVGGGLCANISYIQTLTAILEADVIKNLRKYIHSQALPLFLSYLHYLHIYIYHRS